MRRLTRWLLNPLTALSLLLCVAAVGMWKRSYAATDTFLLPLHGRLLGCDVSNGDILLYACRPVGVPLSKLHGNRFYEVSSPGDLNYRVATGTDFRLGKLRAGRVGDKWSTGQGVLAPLWLVLVMASAIPVVRVGRRTYRVAKRADPRPTCLVCRYNLTGNISGTCAECGTAIVRDST